ncbi:MAG: nucleotide sugar dehydrogenase [Candidatus Aenigmarchaeota archaeon]|nr:nucleotide sugar dehydrogenase [Candidatus Aenigmarchaeota archaeon]
MKVGIIGLGYVGLPLAIKFAEYFEVIGFDINEKRVKELRNRFDRNLGVLEKEFERIKENIEFTNDKKKISEMEVIIIAVPTPISKNKKPNLSYLENTSKTVGMNLKKGTIVVYESTTYPGCTEEFCLPILEKESGLKLGEFSIGYSPERINPGDKKHTIDKIYKIVAGYDNKTTDKLAKIYGKITNVYKAPSIKVAEAAKVVENTQRGLNIALFNELAMLFDKMNLDSKEVFDAASTKWNFLRFYPGFVGGHCIGVDPYYLIEKVKKNNYNPELILSGCKTNEILPYYVARKIFKLSKRTNKDIKNSNILILGATYKEDVPDLRESKVRNMVEELKNLGFEKIMIYEPLINKKEIFGIENINKLEKPDIVVFVVNHKKFENLNIFDLLNKNGILIDLKRKFNKKEAEEKGIVYWGL